DVLAREDGNAARDVDRVLAALEHDREVVERCVRIARAHALDERRDRVVVPVAVAVVANGAAPDGLLDVLLGDLGLSAGARVLVCKLQRRERVPRIAGGGGGDRREPPGPGGGLAEGGGAA